MLAMNSSNVELLIESCLGYFKITPGTGLKGPTPCHCPYCGYSGEQNTLCPISVADEMPSFKSLVSY